jgi:hypothetical protein
VSCACSVLAGESINLSDPREENRIRRTASGDLLIQRWRLISTIVLPDNSPLVPPGIDQVTMTGVIPSAELQDDSTLDDIELSNQPSENSCVYPR